MYYQMPPRKRAHNYVLPFLVIVLLFGAIVLAWWGLNKVFLGDSQSTLNEKVFLNIEAGSAKAMTVGKSDWQNAPDKIYLYRGEGLKTGSDGRATLTFFDQSIMRLNTNSEVSFSSLKKQTESFDIQVNLKKGDAWTKVERIVNPDSKFSITTDLLTIDTRGAVLSVTAPSTVYVLQGNAQIGVKYDDSVFKTYTLGVGQQFSLDPTKLESLKNGEDIETIFALSDEFKQTNWYGWNAKKDGMIDAFEESGTDTGSTGVATDSATGSTTGSTTGVVTDTAAGATTGASTGSTPGAAAGAVTNPTTAASAGLANMDRVAYVTDPSPGFATNKSTFSIKGNYDSTKVRAVYVNGAKAAMGSDGKWSVDSVKLLLEGENQVKLEAEDLAGVKTALDPLVVVYDKTPPAAPVFTDPKATGTESGPIAITTVEQMITGTVSEDTQAVIVNDYRLGKYVPGSKEFQYYAKVAFGNLKAGDNEFKAIAEDKAGNQSEPTTLILTLDQKVIDAAGVTVPTTDGSSSAGSATASTAPSDTGAATGSAKGTAMGATVGATTDTSNLPKASATGGVKITAPNGGESFNTSDTEFEIAGTVPDNSAKVTVNDYALSLYAVGSGTFKYRAYKSIGNLEIGKQNTYTVKAYDEAGKELGSASITIDVESGASADPVITMPSEEATYTTSLDTLVVGGTVGKWVTRVYLNDKEVTDYIPGSEKWKTSIKLSPGKNTFTVVGERDGVQTGKSTIVITLEQ
jgi:hypothetical protein